MLGGHRTQGHEILRWNVKCSFTDDGPCHRDAERIKSSPCEARVLTSGCARCGSESVWYVDGEVQWQGGILIVEPETRVWRAPRLPGRPPKSS